MKTLAIVQARMGSTRLPNKMLLPLGGEPVIDWVVRRLRQAKLVDILAVATTESQKDDSLFRWCFDHNVAVFRGSEYDVLDRFYCCATQFQADRIVRVTGDCPFLDPRIVDEVISLCPYDGSADYASNCQPITYPEGMSVEVLPAKVLEIVWREATLPTHREHVTPFVRFHPERFKHAALRSNPNLSHLRLTIDYEDDWRALDSLAKQLKERYPGLDFSLGDVVNLLSENQHLQTVLSSKERDLWRHQVAKEEGRPVA